MRLGRYDNPYKCVSYDTIDAGVRREPVALEAADGGLSTGMLYTTGRHTTVVCFMHPKADMTRHYAIPALVAAGYAAFGQNSRWVNNDELCVHEQLLLDVAAGVRWLARARLRADRRLRQQRRRLAVRVLHRTVLDRPAGAPDPNAGR